MDPRARAPHHASHASAERDVAIRAGSRDPGGHPVAGSPDRGAALTCESVRRETSSNSRRTKMAMDMFIKIAGLKGESVDKAHTGEIDVLAWSWGLSNSGSAHVGGGAGAGKVNVQDLSFTKYIDKSTPDLMLGACNGKHYDNALLTVRKAGEKPLEYLKITMTEVLVTSVSTGGSGGEDRLTENVTLNFAAVKVDYVEQKKDGSAGDKPSMNWNIAENSKD
jgi:type VI secretion system secreted protein Hcp